MSFPWLTGAEVVVLVLMTSKFFGHMVQLFFSANPGCAVPCPSPAVKFKQVPEPAPLSKLLPGVGKSRPFNTENHVMKRNRRAGLWPVTHSQGTAARLLTEQSQAFFNKRERALLESPQLFLE